MFSPALGHEAVHSPQSGVDVMNEWSCGSTPPTCLLGMQRGQLYLHHTFFEWDMSFLRKITGV